MRMMEQLTSVEWNEFIQGFPPPWADDTLRSRVAAQNHLTRRCVVAFDDDPTGTQTVHDIWVLTSYDPASIIAALQDDEPALYILTNSRSMPVGQAQAVTQQAARNLMEAARSVDRPFTLVSRSDSTLRGHYPAEIDVLQGELINQGYGEIDAVCLIPAFPEGGRFTAKDIHWVRQGNQVIPAAQTPFAQDPVFGYRHSHLPSWVEEKTQGRLKAEQVASIAIETIRQGGPQAVTESLLAMRKGQVVIVNALTYRDLEVFVSGMVQAELQGKRILFRTAAAFVKVAAGITDRSLLTREDLLQDIPPGVGGLVVFGSYVPLSTSQLDELKRMPGVQMVEFPAVCVQDERQRQQTVDWIADRLNGALASGVDAVLFTSREILTGANPESTLAIAARVSSSLMDIVHRLTVQPRFIIGKGGITSSDLATKGLNVKVARVLGQVYPGVPVWKLGAGARWPGISYVVFPGNVGERDTVANIVKMLR